MSDTAVLLCGHGSRDPEAIAEFELAAAGLRAAPRRPRFRRPAISNSPGRRSATGSPALARARRAANPGGAGHAVRREPCQERPAVGDEQLYGGAIRGSRCGSAAISAIDPKLLDAAAERIAGVAPDGARDETLLVVVGRGTNDPDANSNIAKVARMLWEGMGFGWAEAAFSGVAHPRVDAALDRAARLGFRRIVVFPYFLFTGVLVKRIYARDRRGRRALPGDRVRQGRLSARPSRGSSTPLSTASPSATSGDPAMNCQLCKYRTQIVGYEDAVGARAAGASPSCARRRSPARSRSWPP